MSEITERLIGRRAMFGAGAAERFVAALSKILPEGAKILVLGEAGGSATGSAASNAASSAAAMLGKRFRLQRAEFAEASRERAVFPIDEDVMAAVAVGGAECAAVAKYAAKRRGIPAAVLLTCADGGDVLLPSATLRTRSGFPETYRTDPPTLLACDEDLLESGDALTAATVGEVCSRLAGVFDAQVREAICGETFPPEAARLTAELAASVLGYDERELTHAIAARHMVALCALAEKYPFLYGGGGERAAQAYVLRRRAGGDEPKLHGESALPLALITMQAYIAYLARPFARVGAPDNNLRIELLRSRLGINPLRAAERLTPPMGAAELGERLHVLGEYRFELLDRAIAYEKTLRFALRRFKRLYKDKGYSYNKYLNAADMRVSLALASELPGRECLLTLMKQTGALDGLLGAV